MQFRVSDIALTFDRPTPLRHLACSTFRGLLGHALADTDPEAVRRFFKPGHERDEICPYVFQPINLREELAERLDLRLVTFDPAGECIVRFLAALPACVNRSFGESGAMVAYAQHTGIMHLERDLNDEFYEDAVIRVFLQTPARIIQHKKPINPSTFSLPVFLQAGVRRLALVQQTFSLNPGASIPDVLDILGNSHLGQRQLRWVSPRRRSTTQHEDISLGGVVGFFDIHHPSRLFWNLLAPLTLINIGKKTSCGCGVIACRIRP